MIQFDNSKDLKQKEAELYKHIEKIKLSAVMPGRSFPSGNEYAIVDEFGNMLNFCSEVYFPKLNSEIYPQIEAMLTASGMTYKKKITIIGGVKFYVDYIMMERIKTLTVNDVFPKLSIWNSYDGVVKFRKEFGFYKLLCSNGLSRPTQKVSAVSLKHTKHNEQRIEDIVKATKEFLVDSKNDMRVFETMNGKQASANTVLEIAEKLSVSKPVAIAARNRFTLETEGQIQYLNEHNEAVISNGIPKTMFAVYNALNWAVNNCNPKELPEKKLDKDRRIIELVEQYI